LLSRLAAKQETPSDRAIFLAVRPAFQTDAIPMKATPNVSTEAAAPKTNIRGVKPGLVDGPPKAGRIGA